MRAHQRPSCQIEGRSAPSLRMHCCTAAWSSSCTASRERQFRQHHLFDLSVDTLRKPCAALRVAPPHSMTTRAPADRARLAASPLPRCCRRRTARLELIEKPQPLLREKDSGTEPPCATTPSTATHPSTSAPAAHRSATPLLAERRDLEQRRQRQLDAEALVDLRDHPPRRAANVHRAKRSLRWPRRIRRRAALHRSAPVRSQCRCSVPHRRPHFAHPPHRAMPLTPPTTPRKTHPRERCPLHRPR